MQAAYGVYVSSDAWIDAVYLLHLHCAQGVFSHESALFPHTERTICDIVRSRSNVEMQTFQNALKQYAHRKDKDLRRLMHYAELLRVEKTLRQYMEVLL